MTCGLQLEGAIQRAQLPVGSQMQAAREQSGRAKLYYCFPADHDVWNHRLRACPVHVSLCLERSARSDAVGEREEQEL